MNDTHDVHLLSGAYAVGALGDVERARFEAHLETCAHCRVEPAGLSEAAALLAETTATPPPASVREAVLAGIARVRPMPPATPDQSGPDQSGPGQSEPDPSEPDQSAADQSGPDVTGHDPAADRFAQRRRGSRRWLPALAAAAAVVAAVGVGVVVTEPWDDGDGSSQQLTAADRVLAAPDAQRVEHAVGEATATVVVSRSEGRAVLVTEDMPAAPTGKVYELWLQTPDNAMVPAGLMPEGADQTVLLEGDASDAVAVGITVEPEGGSEEPTLPAVAVIELT